MTPRINSGDKFLEYRFFISGRMNPGACILDAFGQILPVLGTGLDGTSAATICPDWVSTLE
ncbi:hypothetical protein [Microcoleus sp. OTE_8_concoct_300]|uniref:hypothetical protein n=1 Tax=Microcoleus sp. OTE_8_concoct_300 TaxID=2964710 RepID=UPI00403F8522